MGRSLKRPTVSEVLSGRASPSIGQLFGLIREVNPTDRALPRDEARSRYLTKTRLIEVLLARFGEDLVLEPEGDGEVIGLHRRLHPADATHLLLSELGEEWRSWVRRRLDEGPPAAESASQLAVPRAVAATPRDLTSLLARGQAALEEYDFEGAEVCWRQAIDRDQDLEASRALLTLWVDQLGRDEDACRLVPELGDPALSDPAIRGLLALASARLGQVAQAREWLSGPPIDASRQADVGAALVQAGLTSRNLAEAEVDLQKLKALAPGHVAIEALTRDLTGLRAEARRPLEVALEEVLEGGDWSEIEVRAEAIRAQWPDSELAGRALARVARHRSEAAVVGLRQEIEAAKTAGEFSKVVEGLRRLKGLAPGPQLEAELAEAIGWTREHETRAIVASLRVALGRAVTSRELLSFLELPASARAELRAAVSTPELVWLEAFEAGRAKIDPAEKVEISIAAAHAERLLAQDQPEQALKHLMAHERRLAGISRGRGLLESCRRQLHQAQEVQAARALAEVEATSAEGRAEAAFLLLQAIEPEQLNPDLKTRWAHLKADADRYFALTSQERALKDAQAAGAHLQAKKALDRLMALDDPANREVHLATRAALEAEIKRSWRLADLRPDSEEDGAIDLRDVVLQPGGEAPLCTVAPDQNTLVWVEVRGALVFVRTIDAKSGGVTRVVVFRTPLRLGHLSVRLEQEILWLAGEKGGLVAYAWRRAEIVDWWDLGKHLDPGESCDRIDVLAGGRFAVMAGSVRGGGAPRLRMIDLERDREHRSFGGEGFGHRVLPNTQEARLALLYLNGGVSLHAANGNVLHGGTIPVEEPLELAVSPDGQGFVLLQGLSSSDDPEDTSIWIRRMSNSGKLGPPLELLGSGSEMIRTLASSISTGWVYVYFRALSEDPAELQGELLERMVPHLAALEPTSDGFELRWRIRVPETTVLLTDADEQVVFVGFGGPAGPQFERLGHTPPSPPGDGPHRARWRVSSDVCSYPLPEGTRVLIDDWKAGDRLEVARSQAWAEKNRDHPSALAHPLYNPSVLKGFDPAPLRSILLDRYPDHPETCLLLATERIRERDWEAAAKILSRADPEATDQGHGQHRLHLTAELQVQFGDLETARSLLEEAAECAGAPPTDCNLGPTFAIVDATERLLQGLSPSPDDWIGQLLQTIRATDEALAQNNSLEALRLIDTPRVWHAREIQSAARRTVTYLRLTSSEDAFLFRKTMAFSTFIELMERRPPFATFSIPVYLATWEGAYLRKIEQDVRRWIELAARA